jgi:hypothetical protein
MIWWPCDPEFVESTETWNGGDGTIAFNHLQQSEEDDSTRGGLYPETTDIWGITG